LIPYTFCALATFRVGHATMSQSMRVVAGFAVLYSIWAISGAGAETVYWGFLLLMAGLPVYVWVSRHD